MRYLIITDIEGVTGVTTYPQAENSPLGREMLMHDLLAVIDGIRAAGDHEIVVYDMHTDGRNVDLSRLPSDIPVVMGKPINGASYKGMDCRFDGLFMVGLHAMSHEEGALLAHSYLREYDAIYINDQLVGEIGVEGALAGEQGIPLLFVSGDDKGCAEAESQFPGLRTAVVKKSLGEFQALCYSPARTRECLKNAAQRAAAQPSGILPKSTNTPVTVEIVFSNCAYLKTMRALHPEIFIGADRVRVQGETLLGCWAEYLFMEREMVSA